MIFQVNEREKFKMNTQLFHPDIALFDFNQRNELYLSYEIISIAK